MAKKAVANDQARRGGQAEKLQEKTIETAWNLFFNEDPKRGLKAAKAIAATGKRLIPTLAEGIGRAGKKVQNNAENVLPILRDVAIGFLKDNEQTGENNHEPGR